MTQVKKPLGIVPFQQNSIKRKAALTKPWAIKTLLFSAQSETEFKAKTGKRHFSARCQNICRGHEGRKKQKVFYAS